jgi:hypothetical protein
LDFSFFSSIGERLYENKEKINRDVGLVLGVNIIKNRDMIYLVIE